MYDDVGPSVGIAIYDDRIEISNPGTLPSNLTVENIKQSHDSYPRNPLMANVLYLSMYLEKWGSGVSRIIEACEQQGLPEPTNQVRGGFVYIIFRRKSYISDNDTQNDTQNVTQNDTQNDTQNSLSERQKKIVEILRKDNRVSIEELTSILSISESTVIRDIRKIRKFMSIKWVGPSKGGHWEVVE